MPTVSETLAAAIAHHQAGRLQEAEASYRLVLQMQPDHAQAWYLFGGLAYQSGNPELAAQRIGQAAELAPNSAEYQFDLGLILHEQGRLEAAAACYQRVLSQNPNRSEVHGKLGDVFRQQARLGDCASAYARAIELDPHSADLHDCLGLVLQQQGKMGQAVACHERAVELRPQAAQSHFNLGNAFDLQEKFDEAIASFRQAIELKENYAEAHCNLGNALRARSKLPEAVACYRRALETDSNFAVAHYNLGNALRDLGHANDAIASYSKALEIAPRFAEAHGGLGAAYRDQGQLDLAVNCFHRAMALKPESSVSLCNLGTALRDQARLPEAIAAFRRALQLDPGFTRAHSNLLFTAVFCSGYGPADLLAEHALWNDLHAKPYAASVSSHPNDRAPGRRLKIGYVSPDFREHVQSHFHIPLFQAHDPGQFEILCYSDVVAPDGRTEKIRTLVGAWRDIRSLTDEQVADLVRADQVDILVDLTMHMERHRLLVFARQPAPVQVTWLAYPGTTGLKAIDYRLTDPYLDPPGMFDRHYSEKSIRLPETFWCYDTLITEPRVNALPASANGYVTFGNLNAFCKVTKEMLQLWARVLRQVPRSRCILLAPEGSCRQWVAEVFGEECIDEARFEFVGRQPRLNYLQTYHQIDIALDTLPYNGHTTSLDSFWMGVPVVTLVGPTVVGRAGLSQLTNLNLTELVAHTPDEFAEIAAHLAADLPRLSHLRSILRSRMEQSPLMNAPRFARNIESAYRQMWQRWCAEQQR